MSRSKTCVVQAKDNNGVLVFNETFSGKKNQRGKMLEAIEVIKSTGGLLRTQVVGAKAWAEFKLEKGSNVAFGLFGEDKQWYR